jgi:uncharacterized RDD family membrane protein YckC
MMGSNPEDTGMDGARGERAVYFADRDYAGPFRRVAILGIDFVAVVVLSLTAVVGTWYIWFTRHPGSEDPPLATLGVMLVVAYLYLTVLKRSRIRSLAYILTGVRIVDIAGKRPSLLAMTIRLLPLLPLPWSFLFDLGWMMDEPGRQTLRDKWAGTFVVRRKAHPAGTAPLRLSRVGLFGVVIIVPEVGRVELGPQQQPAPEPSQQAPPQSHEDQG